MATPTTFRNEIRIEPLGFPEVIKALAKLDPQLREAVRETVRKAIPFAENEAVEQILKRYQISRPSLMDQSSRHGRWKFKPKYPSQTDLSGGIQITGTRMPVMRFEVVPSTPPNQLGISVSARTPISIRITKTGGAQIGKPNVFLAKMKTGHIGVYKRKIPNPGGPRRIRPDKQWTQLPITEEYMLSVPEMLTGKEIRKKFEGNLEKFVLNTFQEELKKIPPKMWRMVAGVLSRLGSIF